jgi:hypothetical protein
MIQCGGCWGFMKQNSTTHYNAAYLMYIISQYEVAKKIRDKKNSPNSFCSNFFHYIHKYMLILSLLSTRQHPGLFKEKAQAGTTQIQEARIWRVQLENKKGGYAGTV